MEENKFSSPEEYQKEKEEVLRQQSGTKPSAGEQPSQQNSTQDDETTGDGTGARGGEYS